MISAVQAKDKRIYALVRRRWNIPEQTLGAGSLIF